MRVDVVGAGAIGVPLAVLLHEAGEDVAVVVREDAAAALAGRALRLVASAGAVEARVPVATATRPEADLVVLAVKTQDVRTACRRVRAGPGAVVVVANGLDADRLAADALPERRIVPAVAVFDAAMGAPGTSAMRREGGLLFPSDAPAEADVLAKAVPTARRADFEGARWTKLLVNLGNGLNAGTGLDAQHAYRGDGARVGLALIREGLAVAHVSDVRLSPIPWAHPRQLRLLARLPDALGAAALGWKVRATFRGAPAEGSTLQSLRRGRPTEVRHLNGAIVARGGNAGVPTPANRAVVEAAEKGAGSTPAAEIARRAGLRG